MPAHPTPTDPATGKRAAQKARSRARLLQSALQLFEERGGGDISIEAVASRAGLSRVGFYLHFASLGELAKELVAPALVELFEHYRKLDDLAPDEESLREWSRGILKVWHANATRIRIGEYVVAVDPELRGLWASGMDDVALLMPRYMQRWEAASERSMGVLRLTAMLVQHERLFYLTMSAADAGHRDEAELGELLTEQAWVLLRREPGRGGPIFVRP